MDGFRIRTATLIVAAALIGLGVGLATGLLSDDDGSPVPQTAAEDGDEAPEEITAEAPGGRDEDEPDLPTAESDPGGLEPGPSGPRPSSSDEVAAARAARTYVRAINERKGGEVCGSFAAGGLDGFKLPERRSSCASSFNASFGFRDGRGRPEWKSSRMTSDVSAQVDGENARVVATVFTVYADIREPTIEDDIIYLTEESGRWLIVKPSSTLYRAVGAVEIPLEAITPP